MTSESAQVIVVTRLADEFKREIDRLSGSAIPVVACSNSSELLTVYSGQPILFGNPGMIAPVLDKMPDVRWVQSSWAGITPMLEIGRRDYILTGVKDVFGPQMAEYTFGYLLAHELNVAERARQQAARHWYREHSGMLEGRTIGIMGTGSIGAYIAGTAAAFNMTALGLSRTGAAVPGFHKVFDVAQIEDFLQSCQYLVATLPQTRGTDNLLNSKTLQRLPDGAYFVNVGRSNVVDDGALIDALNSGKLAGAVLDVFDEEPLPGDSPLWDTKNLKVTAHISAISHPLLIVPIFVENYQRYLDERPLQHVVDLDAGY